MRAAWFVLVLSVVLLGSLRCPGAGSAEVTLPAPTGPHAVGVVRYLLVDSARSETFTPDPDDRREVAVRMWYPAVKPPDAEPVPYIEQAQARKRAQTEGFPLPSAFFDRVAGWKSNAYAGARVVGSDARFPVVIFSHAYLAGMSQSTVLMEELASHGYVVVSVAHAYETSHFIGPDGRVRAFGPDNEQLRARGGERGRTSPVQTAISRTTDPREVDSLIRLLMRQRPGTMRSLHTWVEDISFVIDWLEPMNESGPFRDRLDLGRVGVIGHSFGGSAAGQACLVDERCRAGVNLDGLQIGDMLDRPLDRPFMFVHHDNVEAVNRFPNRGFFDSARDTAYLVLVKGTRHLNFCDLSLPAVAAATGKRKGFLGSIDGLRMLEIQNEYVRAFFDRHLRGEEAGLLDGPSARFPEVELTVNR